MLGAILTALFFGITPVCANRAIRLLGVLRANFFRLCAALAVLGLWAFFRGQVLEGPFQLFVIAGAVGFGLGGLATFQALPRLGAPLTSLVVESLAALFAAAMAWVWFADSLSLNHILFGAVVLLGVVLGLLPYVKGHSRRDGAVTGMVWAVLGALGQAVSITLSRKALLAMKAEGLRPDLPAAAFQRLVGGFLAALALWALWRLWQRQGRTAAVASSGANPAPSNRDAWFWVGLNALFGPILGVTCLIWALKTMQPGLVQSVAATAPLVSVPFARWLEGHRPPRLYYSGSLTAIAGLAGVYLSL